MESNITAAQQLVGTGIAGVLESWAGHKSFAWAGECGIFADYCWNHLRSSGIELQLLSFDDGVDAGVPFEGPPGITLAELAEQSASLNHVWLEHEGRHFDASCTQGVERIVDLPSVMIGFYLELSRICPEKLPSLVSSHTWWARAKQLADEFLIIYEVRDAEYQEN